MGHSDASGAVAEPVWTWRGSNPLPSRCERDALPVELQALMASPRSHSPPGGCALSNPPPRGAGAFGVRVRFLGAIDEPQRGAGGSRTRVRKLVGMVIYVRGRSQTFMSASPATACGSMAPGSYPAGLGRRLKCPPRFAAATGLWLGRVRLVCHGPDATPCAFARLLGGEGEVANVLGDHSCDAIDDGCRIIPRHADRSSASPSKTVSAPDDGCPLLDCGVGRAASQWDVAQHGSPAMRRPRALRGEQSTIRSSILKP